MSNRRWSAQQNAIFAWFAALTVGAALRHLVVRARAGTGKTTTILEAVTRAPRHIARILVCAFNTDIARELQARVTDPRVEARTLHSLGNGFIRTRCRVELNADRGYSLAQEVCGQDAPPEMITLVKKLASLGKNCVPFAKDGAALLDLALQYDCAPEGDDWEDAGWTVHTVCTYAAKAMTRAAAVETDHQIDFDDMLFVPVVRGWITGRYDLVVVDEAQDMNACQLLLAQGACKKNGSLVVVGDDRQAIYGFRGADSGALDRLKDALKAQELGLTVTYRCPKLVVARAQGLVPDFTAAEEAPQGLIGELRYAHLVEAAQGGDFILSRKNAPLVGTCLALLRQGKRAVVRGRDIGKGLVALVRKLAGKHTSVAQFMTKLATWELRETTRAEAAGKAGKAKVVEIADRAETLRALAEGIESVAKLTDRITALFEDASPRGAVICSSVHKAKGLEAERVFLLQETFYPGGRRGDLEEQNIEYVAITRAKRELVIVTGLEQK